jgi:hypothetical protein
LAQIFPKWTNLLPLLIVPAVLVLAGAAVGFVWYYGSPWYTDVGYQPEQPIDYNHKLHAGDLGIDCRYCHNYVEWSPRANIPPTQTCMNCHTIIKSDSEKLIPVLGSWSENLPIEWIRVHSLPDYAYFNHSAHLEAGIGCISCHGNVDRMPKVTQIKPLSMSWCLECHRNPGEHLRPVEEITNMNYIFPGNQATWAQKTIIEKNIKPPTDCSGCHR